MSVRSLAERLSRGVVLRRRLPAAFGRGRLFVSPESGGLRYWRRDLGRADPSLLDVVDEFVRPGMTVWDIGANVGLFTFSAAHRAGPGGAVLAVEADVDNVALLLRSRRAMAAGENATVDILPAAVAKPGQRFARFRIASRSRSSNALAGFGQTQSGGFVEERRVPVFTLDELLADFGRPQFIKMDVEGAELDALSGAARVLGEVRPSLVTEVDPSPEHGQAFANVFRQFNYRLYDADAPRELRKPLDLPAWNCLCIPQ